MVGFCESPCWWANDALPTILRTVVMSASVGAWKICHPRLRAMLKSRLLKGSAMLALLGTRLRICVSCCLLCHAQ